MGRVLADLDADELRRRRDELGRLLDDDGVSDDVHDSPGPGGGHRDVDPVPRSGRATSGRWSEAA